MVVEVQESDSAGKTICTYLISDERVDIVRPRKEGTLINEVWTRILAAFLPVGYPYSVSADYTQYQIYDSLQAFCSSIAGLLASRAVLEGVGVGDSTASPTAALLLTIVQDSAGRIATILFAHRLGTALEPECKMWRLAADVFNDAAMIIDCLSPVFPRTPRVLLLSASSSLRALCGVAAGSAKASLSAHFAKWGNLGELNAKDSSQETVISLIGMLAGSIVVSYVTTPSSTWICLLSLVSLHLAMNYAAVRAVSMRTLNRQRASMVFSQLFDGGPAMRPEEVSRQETIFEKDGVLRWRSGPVLAYAKVGVPFHKLAWLLKHEGITSTPTACRVQPVLAEMLELFAKEPYLLWYAANQGCVLIVMKSDTGESQLKAWVHALLLVRQCQSQSTEKTPQRLLEAVQASLVQLQESWEQHVTRLDEAGWDLTSTSIKTTSGTRFGQ